MSQRAGRRSWARPLPAIAVLVLGSACAPAGLDAGQRAAEAKACASLIERRVGLRVAELEGTDISLATDPARFYSVLAAERGPERFARDNPATTTDYRASVLSRLCSPEISRSSDSGSGPATSTKTSDDGASSDSPGAGPAGPATAVPSGSGG
ncbi:MAG: hypothetical protein ACT4PW_01425 [Acidimicrobiia bacterium]